MKRLTCCLIYFPALISWVVFVYTWKFANKIFPCPGSHYWSWSGVEAIYMKINGVYK